MAGGAVRVFGLVGEGLPSRADWNDPDGWRAAFEGLADGPPFVAESFLGEQYRVIDKEVVRWSPETGGHESTGLALDAWLDLVRTTPDEEVPIWLLDEWQALNGVLPPDQHLAPDVPFILGGAYELGNLHRVAADADMRWRAQLATKLRDLPDGSEVRLHIKWEA